MNAPVSPQAVYITYNSKGRQGGTDSTVVKCYDWTKTADTFTDYSWFYHATKAHMKKGETVGKDNLKGKDTGTT